MFDLVNYPRQALEAILEARGMSQNALAKESGVSQSLISRVMTGSQTDLSGRTIKKLCRFLPLSPEAGPDV